VNVSGSVCIGNVAFYAFFYCDNRDNKKGVIVPIIETYVYRVVICDIFFLQGHLYLIFFSIALGSRLFTSDFSRVDKIRK